MDKRKAPPATVGNPEKDNKSAARTTRLSNWLMKRYNFCGNSGFFSLPGSCGAEKARRRWKEAPTSFFHLRSSQPTMTQSTTGRGGAKTKRSEIEMVAGSEKSGRGKSGRDEDLLISVCLAGRMLCATCGKAGENCVHDDGTVENDEISQWASIKWRGWSGPGEYIRMDLESSCWATHS